MTIFCQFVQCNMIKIERLSILVNAVVVFFFSNIDRIQSKQNIHTRSDKIKAWDLIGKVPYYLNWEKSV